MRNENLSFQKYSSRCLKVNFYLLLSVFIIEVYIVKCSQLYRILIKDGWYPISQKVSHVKMKHDKKPGLIVFPNHGSQEMGKGLENKILKDAGIRK